MTGLRSIAVKFSAFALIAVLLGVLLVNTMLNGVPGDTSDYHVELADASGLRVGDDVRVAGVRVGRVTGIEAGRRHATVDIEVVKDQPLLGNTHVVMRYQNLIGQRYLSLVQPARRATELAPGATVPLERTSPGFDLTELLNGFRPLFQVLQPEDVNRLAGSLVKVLQGEGGTVEGLLRQTGQLTSRLADRDEVFDEVLANLTPVLENVASQGDELRGTVKELRRLMTGLARDRRSIGSSIDSMSQLIDGTSRMLADARRPSVRAVHRFRRVMEEFMAEKRPFVNSVHDFPKTLAALGRAGSYGDSINVYICSLVVAVQQVELNLNGNDQGPWSEVCR